jgi:hypothetical protein
MSITVSYIKPTTNNEKTGSIEIVDTSKKTIQTVEVKTKDFYTFKDKKPKTDEQTEKNDNDDDFTDLQKKMRYIDIVKDAQISPSTNKYTDRVYNYGNSVTDLLKNWKSSFNKHFEHMTKPYPWTKKTKTSTSPFMLSSRIIFKESGLNAAEFITPPSPGKKVVYVGNIANEVIDTGQRAEIITPDIRFPDQGSIDLVLNKDFLALFGFEGCSLTSKRPQTDYEFKINIETTPPIGAITKTNIKEWALGNVRKNEKIIELIEQDGQDHIIKGLFLIKEMGDVLQVLIMFIWTKLNANQPYSMVTGDKVVLLLCMVLQLNCILTSGEKNEVNKEIRLRHIDVFEPDGYTKEKAIERFNESYKSIYAENNKFISSLTRMRRKNPNIYVKQITNPIKIPKNIYDKFISDLTEINKELKNIISNTRKGMGNKTAIEIDQYTSLIKINFSFNLFITVLKNKTLRLSAYSCVYTSNNTLWKSKIDPSEGSYIYADTKFYDLITKPNMLEISRKSQTGGLLFRQEYTKKKYTVEKSAKKTAKKTAKKPNNKGFVGMIRNFFYKPLNNDEINILSIKKDEIKKASTINILSIREDGIKNSSTPNILYIREEDEIKNASTSNILPIVPQNNQIVDTNDIIVSIKDDVSDEYSDLELPDEDYELSYYDKETEYPKLYALLIKQIKDYLTEIEKVHYFQDVYAQLLHYFYLTNEVLYDEELKQLIVSMFKDVTISKTKRTTKRERSPALESPVLSSRSKNQQTHRRKKK